MSTRGDTPNGRMLVQADEQREAGTEQSRDRRQADEHDRVQDAQMARLIVSVATLTDQMAEITVAQHRAARDLADRGHEISEIRDTVKANAETAKEVLDLFGTLKGGFKVLGWLGVAAKGIAGLAAAAAALWAAYVQFRHGGGAK